MSDKGGQVSGLEPTVAPASGLDATVAPTSGLDATVAPTSGLDATVAPASPGASAPGRSSVLIRAGAADYSDLLPIDRQHYVVGEELARGGMGRILVARDRRLGRKVAIKELLVDTPQLRSRFEREAHITAKLQHPAIVNIIEAGVWPSGEAFYVMKLVSGEPLDKVVAARASLEQRLALIPNVIAAVDALAYAHDHRVIHRDLKPANVLVGAYGETVVIDWGLAKDLSDTSAVELDVGPYRSNADPDATVAGAVMGTPAYMPPEQALGEVVDERADVYSLGAMLYHVLVGEPPFTGKSAEAILQEVIASPIVPLAGRVPGVPHDLVAIVEKSLAKDKDQRYAKASDLAADLKRFQTGQLVGARRYSTAQLVRRWLKRHRTAVTVAAIALVSLVVVGIASIVSITREQERTETQRVVAEDNRVRAEDLMSFMLTDLIEKLRPIGKLDLLDTIVQKSTTYFASKPLASATGPELMQRARAQTGTGDVRFERGDVEASIAAFRDALLTTDLVASAERDRPWHLERARELHKYARSLEVAGKLVEAVAQYKLAIEEAATADRSSQTHESIIALKDAHVALGNLLSQRGDKQAASAELATALAIARRLDALDPGSPRTLRTIASVEIEIASVDADLGKRQPAVAAARRVLETRKALLAKDPRNTALMRETSLAAFTIGSMLIETRDLEGALAAFREYLGLSERLVAIEPANATWRNDVGIAHHNISFIYNDQGRPADAIAEGIKALDVFKAGNQSDPTNQQQKRSLASGHSALARFHADARQLDKAEAEARASLTVYAEIAATTKTPKAQLDVAHAHTAIGDVMVAKRDAAAARVEFEAAAGMTRKLIASDRSDTDLVREFAIGVTKLGDLAIAGKDLDGALAHYQDSAKTFDELQTRDPGTGRWKQDLALVNDKLGTTYLEKKQSQEAIAHFRRALELRSTVANASPSLDGQHKVVVSHFRIATALMQFGPAADAVTEAKIVVDLMNKLIVAYPAESSLLGDLYEATVLLGDAYRAANQPTEMTAAFDAAGALIPKLGPELRKEATADLARHRAGK